MPDPTRDPPNSIPTVDPAPARDTRNVGEQTNGPADLPPGEPPAAPAAPAGYELQGEIGRGGMGVVYRAHDTSLNRDVAVKLLQSKYPPHGHAAHRFVEEARITGQLQHPGIPPVHAVGTLPDGRPFIAMKLIKGRTLAELLDDGATGRGALIAVFEQVCQAVAYAHSHGVIHRDLKPQNVMVGAFGEVQVMDWGLAKFRAAARTESAETTTASTFYDPREDADESLKTRAGSFLGTPAYMSPEQAIGAVDQIDQRSDVFGLGAVLCAILTGQPPFVANTPETTRQLAAQGKIDAAFERLDDSRSEPELVALGKRCLSPEPANRPADAGEVAKAVAGLRTAADERARRAELDRAAAEVRVAEQRRRRRWQLALAAAVLVIVTGGGAVAWWQQRQAEDRRGQLTRNGDALAELVGVCEEAIRANDVDRAGAALAQIDRRLSEGGGEAVQDRAERCRADLALLRELDAIDTFRTMVLNGQSPDEKQVVKRWRDALAGYGVVPGITPPADAAGRICRSLVANRLLTVLDLWLSYESSPALRDLLRTADPDLFRDAMRDAVVAGDKPRQAELGGRPEALGQSPHFSAVLGQLDAVPSDRRQVVLESALRPRPGDLTLLMAIHLASFQFGETKNPPPHAKWKQLRWAQAAVVAHPRNLDVRNRLAWVLYQLDDFDGAITEYREALRLDPACAQTHTGIGETLEKKGDLEGAIAEYREAIRLDPGLASAHLGIAHALEARGDLNGAIASYREAAQLIPTNATMRYILGNKLLAKGDMEAAVASFREAVRLDPKEHLYRSSLVEVLQTKGNYAGAIDVWREAIRLNPKDASYHHALGDVLVKKGDLDGAISSYHEAIHLDPKDARHHHFQGYALKEKRDLDGAVASFQEALRLYPKDEGTQDNLVELCRSIGEILQVRGDLDGAIASFREALSLNPTDYGTRFKLVEALNANGDAAGIVAVWREAVRLDPAAAFAHWLMGDALRAAGDLEGSITSYQMAARLEPNKYPPFSLASYFNDLAWLLATGSNQQRDGGQAVAHAVQACELTGWKVPSYIDTLAAAHAEAGDFDKAIEYQQQALGFPKFAAADGPKAMERLYMYTQKKPYRETLRAVAPLPHPVGR